MQMDTLVAVHIIVRGTAFYSNITMRAVAPGMRVRNGTTVGIELISHSHPGNIASRNTGSIVLYIFRTTVRTAVCSKANTGDYIFFCAGCIVVNEHLQADGIAILILGNIMVDHPQIVAAVITDNFTILVGLTGLCAGSSIVLRIFCTYLSASTVTQTAVIFYSACICGSIRTRQRVSITLNIGSRLSTQNNIRIVQSNKSILGSAGYACHCLGVTVKRVVVLVVTPGSGFSVKGTPFILANAIREEIVFCTIDSE